MCSCGQKNNGWIFAILPVVLLLVGILLGLPLLIGIWVPDVITASRHTLAETHLANGYSFRVLHYWNRSDFYSTELHVTSPDGRTEVHTLDGDDSKTWKLPLRVDQKNRRAVVILGGNRVRTVDW